MSYELLRHISDVSVYLPAEFFLDFVLNNIDILLKVFYGTDKITRKGIINIRFLLQ